MYKYLVICNILLTTYIQGNAISAIKVPVKTAFDNELSQAAGNITIQAISESGSIISKNPITIGRNKTNQAVSEGGSLIPSIPITLSNYNESFPKNLDKDLSINKGKSVPRKGVVYNPSEDIIGHDKVEQSLVKIKSNNLTNTTIELSKSNKGILNESNTLIGTKNVNVTRVHKPLILSHEALAKMDEMNHLNLDENGPDIKVHSMKAGSHPGMIMPIVITILVVPMFAVLGYMAIKRGQEAWKNRHYKRMDFLLDGMYND